MERSVPDHRWRCPYSCGDGFPPFGVRGMLIEGIQVPPDVLVIHPPGPIVGEHCVPDGFPGSLVVVQGKFTSPDRVWANCDGFDDICSELSMTPSHEAIGLLQKAWSLPGSRWNDLVSRASFMTNRPGGFDAGLESFEDAHRKCWNVEPPKGALPVFPGPECALKECQIEPGSVTIYRGKVVFTGLLDAMQLGPQCVKMVIEASQKALETEADAGKKRRTASGQACDKKTLASLEYSIDYSEIASYVWTNRFSKFWKELRLRIEVPGEYCEPRKVKMTSTNGAFLSTTPLDVVRKGGTVFAKRGTKLLPVNMSTARVGQKIGDGVLDGYDPLIQKVLRRSLTSTRTPTLPETDILIPPCVAERAKRELVHSERQQYGFTFGWYITTFGERVLGTLMKVIRDSGPHNDDSRFEAIERMAISVTKGRPQPWSCRNCTISTPAQCANNDIEDLGSARLSDVVLCASRNKKKTPPTKAPTLTAAPVVSKSKKFRARKLSSADTFL